MKLLYSQVSNSILNVKKDLRTEVFNFGIDNAFPSMVEALINMSVTAKTCVDRVAKAIQGGNFGEAGKVVVNSKGESLNEVLRIACREYATHNNLYIHLGFDGNLDYKAINIIPVTTVRLGKDDDKGYSGKFILYDNWDKSKGKKIMSDSFEEVDRFNTTKGVVEGQVEAVESLQDYNGQLIHIKKDSAYVYSLTDLNPVLSEALLEANSQTFRSRGAEKGFLNTKILGIQPFKSDEERRSFKKEMNEVRGANNSSEVIVMEAAQQTEDLSKQIFIDDLSSPYNDKLFEYSDKQAEKNICKAFSVPLMLVNPSDNSLFGNSGEVLKEAKKQLFESRSEDRAQLEEAFVFIMENFTKPVSGLEIINPFEEIEEPTNTEEDV